MEIRKLRVDEWPGLIPIFNKTFDSDMPSPNHAEIIGVFEEGRLEAFLLKENVIMIDQVWSRTPKNHTNFVKAMLKFVRASIPDKQAVATMSDGKRFEILFKMLGMQKIAGTLFRRNSK